MSLAGQVANPIPQETSSERLVPSHREGLARILQHACERAHLPAGILLWENAGRLHPIVWIGLGVELPAELPVPVSPEGAAEVLPPDVQQKVACWTARPLQWHEQRVGWLFLGGPEPLPPQVRHLLAATDQLDLVTLLLAAWIEAAQQEQRLLARRRAEEALLQRTRQAEKQAALLRAIGSVSRQVLALLNPRSLLQGAVDALVENLGYDYAHVLLAEEGYLVVRASAGKSEPVGLEFRLLWGQGITGRVVTTGQPYLCNDVDHDPHYVPIAELVGIRSELALPIRNSTEVCGVLDVQSMVGGAFDEADLLALSTLADQLGMALENAQLLDSLHERMAELERTRARLSQAEKLSALGELIANAAHELNNPLTSVIGYAQLLQSTIQDPAALRDLATIVQAAQRAARIVEDLLIFARQRVPDFQPTDVAGLIRQVVSLQAGALAEVHVGIKLALVPDLPPVRADPGQLELVLVNMIANARQALVESSRRGNIEVRASLAEPGKRPGEWVRIEVIDDGPGISHEDLLRIFDPFFTTRENLGGTGMGLSICYGIIVRHGGIIWAESEPGKGAHFFVELPVWRDGGTLGL